MSHEEKEKVKNDIIQKRLKKLGLDKVKIVLDKEEIKSDNLILSMNKIRPVS